MTSTRSVCFANSSTQRTKNPRIGSFASTTCVTMRSFMVKSPARGRRRCARECRPALARCACAAASARSASSRRMLRVFEDADDRERERGRVGHGRGEHLLVAFEHFSHDADIGGDDRHLGERGFDERDAVPFIRARLDERLGAPHQAARVGPIAEEDRTCLLDAPASGPSVRADGVRGPRLRP